MANGNYEKDTVVQVKNSHSGHWVYGKVISTEPDGIAVRYGKANKQELVPPRRVRLPQPKVKAKARKPATPERRPATSAPEANTGPADKAKEALEEVETELENLNTQREVLDAKIGALVQRRNELRSYLKVDAEFR